MTYIDWIARHFDKSRDSVLITGGSSGIGLEYLRLLAAERCHCIVVSNEPERFVELRRSVLEQFGVPIDTIECDLSNYEAVIALETRLASFQIRMLINNAGFGLKGEFTALQKDAYRQIVAVNALAPTLISHMVLPAMRQMDSAVHISVASINVASPMAKNAVYTATKHYVWSYALALSKEYEDSGIHFQIMLPGTTDTPFHDKQGVKPASMTMQPKDVALRSLSNLDHLVFIPNVTDRLVYPIGSRLPIRMRMRIASWMMKKRLGV